MRAFAIAAALIFMAPPLPAADQAKDWVDIKDPQELRALFSNMTFKGTDYLDRPWVGHYRADGHGVVLFQGAEYPRTWAVRGENEVCVTWAMGNTCYRFQRHRTEAGRYRNWLTGNDRMISNFRVEQGVPKF